MHEQLCKPSGPMEMKIFSWKLDGVVICLWRGHTQYYGRCSRLPLVLKVTLQISLEHLIDLSTAEIEVLQQMVLGVEQQTLPRLWTHHNII